MKNMVTLITELKDTGYLEIKTVDGEEVYHLTTPCVFRISEDIVSDLKKNYKEDEETGGVLWAKPTNKNGDVIYLIEKVTYIRNAIEDNPRSDRRDKSNSYLPDLKQLNDTVCEVYKNKYLPIDFHTHPVKKEILYGFIKHPDLITETSMQDVKASYIPYNIENKKLLLPDALIVGSDITYDEIFIGFYNGFIAPTEFESSKKKIQKEHLRKTTDYVTSIKLTDLQKAGMLIGATLLIYVIAKHPKSSLTVLAGIGALLPILMTSTQNIKQPEYFNKLSYGSAEIFIPKQ